MAGLGSIIRSRAGGTARTAAYAAAGSDVLLAISMSKGIAGTIKDTATEATSKANDLTKALTDNTNASKDVNVEQVKANNKLDDIASSISGLRNLTVSFIKSFRLEKSKAKFADVEDRMEAKTTPIAAPTPDRDPTGFIADLLRSNFGVLLLAAGGVAGWLALSDEQKKELADNTKAFLEGLFGLEAGELSKKISMLSTGVTSSISALAALTKIITMGLKREAIPPKPLKPPMTTAPKASKPPATGKKPTVPVPKSKPATATAPTKPSAPPTTKPPVAATTPVPKSKPATTKPTPSGSSNAGLTADNISREVDKNGKVRYRNKATGKYIAKATGEEILEAITKSASKSALLSAGKKIPLIGAGIGLLEAGIRSWFGDDVGAGIALGSGVASTLPGAGTAVSIAADITNLTRDVFAMLHPEGLHPEKAYKQAMGDPEKMKELKAFEASIKAAVVDEFNKLIEPSPNPQSVLNPRDKISLLQEELGWLQESSMYAGAPVQPARQAILQQQIQDLQQRKNTSGQAGGINKNTIVSTQNDSNISSSADEDIGSAGMAFPIDDYSSFSLSP